MSSRGSSAKKRSSASKATASPAMLAERAAKSAATADKRLDAYRKAVAAVQKANYTETTLTRAENAYASWEKARATADRAYDRAAKAKAKGDYEADVRKSLPDRFKAVGEAEHGGQHFQYLESRTSGELYRRREGSRDIRWESVNPLASEAKIYKLTGDASLKTPPALRREGALIREEAQREAQRAQEAAREAAQRERDNQAGQRMYAEARAYRQREEQRAAEIKAAQRARAAERRQRLRDEAIARGEAPRRTRAKKSA